MAEPPKVGQGLGHDLGVGLLGGCGCRHGVPFRRPLVSPPTTTRRLLRGDPTFALGGKLLGTLNYNRAPVGSGDLSRHLALSVVAPDAEGAFGAARVPPRRQTDTRTSKDVTSTGESVG